MGNAAETGANGSQEGDCNGIIVGIDKLTSSACCTRKKFGKLDGPVSGIEDNPAATDEAIDSGGLKEGLRWYSPWELSF